MNKNKKSMLIGGLLAVVLLLAVGYAAFATTLDINGTSKIDSRWDVEITNITADKTSTCSDSSDISTCTTVGNVSHSITNNNLTANFSTVLISPGDVVTYTITVQNKGTLNAELESIISTRTSNSAITMITSGIRKGDVIVPNGTANLTIVVTYNDVTKQPTVLTKTLSVTLNYKQHGGNGTNEEGTNKVITDALSDGLYKDTASEEERYVYKGADPANYICLGELVNNECPTDLLYRIISTEEDGTMKVIKNTPLETPMAFDTANARKATGTFCTVATGCKVWGSKTTMLDENGSNITKMPLQSTGVVQMNLPSIEASLNTYLNGEYYENLSFKDLITTHTFNVGYISNSINDTMITEKRYKWNGKIGVMNVSDYLNANSDSANCSTVSILNVNSSSICNATNWIFAGNGAQNTWTLSLYSGRSDYVMSVTSVGSFNQATASTSKSIRPVFYLKSGIQLEGAGTNDTNIYTIS